MLFSLLLNSTLFSLYNDYTTTNSIATFYFRTGPNLNGCPSVQTFNDNKTYGPCGVKYTSESKYWVAIKNAKNYCGKSILVSYNGKNTTKLKIMDECPGCYKDNHIDMSLDALVELTGSKEKACAINTGLPQISWTFI